MSAPALIKQSDMERIVRGCVAAGQPLDRVEIEPGGKVVIFLSTGESRPAPPRNPWDDDDGD